jgi:hypothetical protein
MAHKLRFLLPLVAVLAAGCGSTQTLTRAQLVARADPICASASAKREAANATLGHATSLASPPTLEALAKTAPALGTYESQVVSRLRQLNAPASLAGDWKSMLAGLQQLANDTVRLGAYAKEKNVTGGEKLIASSKNTRRQILTIAIRDGLGPCGRAN